ncbi:MAG: argininosuccinate lyase [Candidatus Bathyarchaeota archaeon]|nr:argininosuccinate lyase [Candidatus Bathyarchaeum tardum]WGM89717.1 MAG: argininosuccinate lyase [Candidatus Bathyarchaeum tardum]WNZ30186.1 MAG: argininosuccinate lyase [Candidatus Bathyarchaeota archaeon]
MSKLLRGGRIGSARKDAVEFTASIKSDKKLLEAVIKINKAHVTMLTEQQIISTKTGTQLLKALSEINPKMELDPCLEDVHLAVEEEINKKLKPEIAGNLHVAKSRNDQVATAIRMALRTDILDLIAVIVALQESLIGLAEKNTETLVPSYTHLHPAQPITFGHLLVSYVDAIERSINRLQETYSRVNMCPMGAGAIATTSFPINRNQTAQLLGFNGVLENSIDAVGSRDFVLETLADLTLLATDVSRIAEDFLVWSSPDFGILDLPESFAFTSSIMPQKKNPDVLEVIRARMSQILGNFVACATTMKALPSGYNLDLQELTPKLWESIETVEESVCILSELAKNLKVNPNVFGKQVLNYSTATELANMLVKKYAVPFRSSHKIVGTIVKTLIDKKLALSDLSPEQLNKTAKDCAGITLAVKLEDIKDSIDPKKCVESHKTLGGPAPTEVKRMLKNRLELMSKSKTSLIDQKSRLEEADMELESAVQRYSTKK